MRGANRDAATTLRHTAECAAASALRGYPDATNIAALVNVGWMLVLNIAIAAAAIQRLAEGTRRVQGLPVLIVSGIAAAVMLAGSEPAQPRRNNSVDEVAPGHAGRR